MITTNRDDLAELCRNIRNHGEKYGKQPYLGYNYRMTEAAAAFGLAQLRRLDSTLRTQIRCAEIVRNNLPEGLHPLPVPTTTKPSFFIVAALTDNSFNREDWVAKAQSKLFNGVSKPGETIGLGYAELIPDLPFFLFLNKPSIPVARETIKRTVWFDVHRFVSEEIVRARVDALKEIK